MTTSEKLDVIERAGYVEARAYIKSLEVVRQSLDPQVRPCAVVDVRTHYNRSDCLLDEWNNIRQIYDPPTEEYPCIG